MTRPDSAEGVEYVEPEPPWHGRRKYRYDVRQFKVEDGGYHECSGQVVAVLGSTYSQERRTWYLTVLVRKDRIIPGLTPGEEVWKDSN